jgi:hypothetical protein
MGWGLGSGICAGDAFEGGFDAGCGVGESAGGGVAETAQFVLYVLAVFGELCADFDELLFDDPGDGGDRTERSADDECNGEPSPDAAAFEPGYGGGEQEREENGDREGDEDVARDIDDGDGEAKAGH